MKTRDELERERSRAKAKRETSYIGVGGAVLIVAGAVAIWFFVTATPDPAEKPEVIDDPATSMVRDPGECERLIQLFRRDGIVKGARVGGRVTVDEKRWRAASEDVRRGLLSDVSCAAYGGDGLDELEAGSEVTVESASSGKLLAKAGKEGIVFAP